MNYTDEQRDLLAENGNCVVIAAPGSGKTATLTAMVRAKIQQLPSHKGVIAISYTNKASTELRQRIKHGGFDAKASFFGTIDKFFISEVIIPFGRHVWQAPEREVTVMRVPELNAAYERVNRKPPYSDAKSLCEDAALLGRLYQKGIVVLEAVGFMACYVLGTSQACRRYLRARYSDIFVDEYQDCGPWQHNLFLALVESGVRGVAVGDLDQAIFSWADKFPQFLRALDSDPRFTSHRLTVNHRCHPAIARYARMFIFGNDALPPDGEKRVFLLHVPGSELEVGEWLNSAVPEIERRFAIETRDKIGVLVRYTRTAELLKTTLTIPYRHMLSTALDTDNSPASTAFRNTLNWLFNARATRREFVDEFLDPATPRMTQRKVVHLLSGLQQTVPFDSGGDSEIVEILARIAAITTGRSVPPRALRRLAEMLDSGEWAHYIPPHSGEIQLMTIHKAKGLEFQAVVVLDLFDDTRPNSPPQTATDEVNLHYVALTRAKDACILCTASQRHNSYNKLLTTRPSPFLARSGLADLHEDWK